MSIETNIIETRKTFQLPIHAKPTLLDVEEMSLHLSLIREEIKELTDAYNEDDLTEVFDGIVDTIYVLAGLAVHMGLPLDEGWREVHRSNMSKLDANKEPIFSDGTDGFPEGKFLKGPFYTPPRLDLILESAKAQTEGTVWND